MSVIDTVKSHPMIAGGVALVAIIIIVILSSGSSATTAAVSTDPTGSTVDGTAMQVAQLQASSTANGLQAQLQALQLQNAGATALATIAAQSTDNANYLAYKGHSEDTQAALTSSTLQSSLAAQIAATQSENAKVVALAGYSNQQSLATIQANQNIATQSILEHAVESANNTTTTIAGIQANTTIQTTQINALLQQDMNARQVAAAQSNSQNALSASLSHDQHSGGLFGGGGFLGLGF